MNGFIPVKYNDQEMKNFIVKSGTTIAQYDPISIDASTSGFAIVATSSTTPAGIYIGKTSITGDGTTDYGGFLIDPCVWFIADNDEDGGAQAVTHQGTYGSLTGTTGAVQLDTSTFDGGIHTATDEIKIIEYNPQGFDRDTDTSISLCCFSLHFFK